MLFFCFVHSVMDLATAVEVPLHNSDRAALSGTIRGGRGEDDCAAYIVGIVQVAALWCG